ncbi:hypothetical protein [Frondihabitans sp. PAMC 28766]|uniref:hypothetical protein n=1 Tax=Frondihabitans sp. PAMC 28766 TaxID=1795630 RepID=UPI0012FF8D1F|nr:hypothetical protein [Frondihabitans sp. PAMC 28766]
MKNTRRKLPPGALAAILVAHSLAAALTWRDISARPERLIRGSKDIWRFASVINRLGVIGYWTLGRRLD